MLASGHVKYLLTLDRLRGDSRTFCAHLRASANVLESRFGKWFSKNSPLGRPGSFVGDSCVFANAINLPQKH